VKKKPQLREAVLKWLLTCFVIFLAGSFDYFLLFHSLRGPASSRPVKIYFLKGERLMAVSRAAVGEAPAEREAVDALLKGPTKEEAQRGYFSEIPDGTKAKKVYIEDSVAFVDFNGRIGDYGGGSARVQGIVSQIVYTLTELPGIKKVGILVEGRSEVVLGGEGYILEKPLSREDVRF